MNYHLTQIQPVLIAKSILVGNKKSFLQGQENKPFSAETPYAKLDNNKGVIILNNGTPPQAAVRQGHRVKSMPPELEEIAKEKKKV